MFKNRIKKTAAFVLITAMAATVPAQAQTSDEIKGEMGKYETQLSETESKKESLIQEIEKTAADIEGLAGQIKELTLEKESYLEGMGERIRYFYENSFPGGISEALEDLLSQSSFAKMLNKLEEQETLYRYDERCLDSYMDCIEKLNKTESKLTASEEELDTLMERLNDKAAGLSDTISQKESEYEKALQKEEEERNAEEAKEAAAAAQKAAEEAEVYKEAITKDTDYSVLSKNDAQTEVAQKVYSVLKKAGWPDEMIAGALGNIQAESGFDFTSVEWLSWHCNESFRWGPNKQEWDDGDYLIADLNPGQSSTVVRSGIGLIQWTDTKDGATGNSRLREYAAAKGTVWYDLDLQLRFLTDTTAGDTYRAGMIKNYENYTAYPTGTPEECAYWWAGYIEGCTYDLGKRQSYARSWYEVLPSLTYDEGYAESILG